MPAKGSRKKQVECVCQYCGKRWETYQSWARTYCSRECANAARVKPTAEHLSRWPSWTIPDHPLADRGGRVSRHRAILYEKIGPGSHPCHWCGQIVRWMPGAKTSRGALIVDHLDRDGWNESPENLVPSCHRCNSQRHRTDWVRDDEPFVVDSKGFRHRAVIRTCEFCGQEFPHLAADNRPNRGRFCSMSCARKDQWR